MHYALHFDGGRVTDVSVEVTTFLLYLTQLYIVTISVLKIIIIYLDGLP
jgi:hypothetical protein